MDVYATHMTVLCHIVTRLDIQSVFEFGSGLNSTQLFVSHCRRVLSIEMQSREWYDKVRGRFYGRPNFNCSFLEGPVSAVEVLRTSNAEFDLVFVDG